MGLQEVRRGEKSNFASLSEMEVVEIRERFRQGGITQKDLGALYNVSRTCISFVVNRKTWKHI